MQWLSNYIYIVLYTYIFRRPSLFHLSYIKTSLTHTTSATINLLFIETSVKKKSRMSKSSMFPYHPLSPPFTFIVTCLFNKLLCDAFGAQLKYLNIFFYRRTLSVQIVARLLSGVREIKTMRAKERDIWGGKFVASKVFVRKLQFTRCLLQHHNCGLQRRWHYVGVAECKTPQPIRGFIALDLGRPDEMISNTED